MDDDVQDAPPAPIVNGRPMEIADGVFVVPDGRVPLVPNVGIVLGNDRALVVDTGMGPANGARVRGFADELAGDRELVLTITHFHPEHGFGAQAFRDATIVYNRAQLDELHDKGGAYLDMFRTFGEAVAEQLAGVELVDPDETYDRGSHRIDLGGRTIELHDYGRAHTRGDQIVLLPSERVLFTGDLVEERCFAIFPYFPPDDADVDGEKWIAVLERLEALEPAIVVPGHGEVGGVDLITTVREYLVQLRDETRACAEAGVDVDVAVGKIDASMRALHPDWAQPEWIGFGVRHFYAASSSQQP
jgi:glyoxylase-like metal-dependent hydrolase (beta-lactamase superfamily II)